MSANTSHAAAQRGPDQLVGQFVADNFGAAVAGGSVLEVGSRLGYNCIFMEKVGGFSEVVGIDPDRDAVEIAKQNARLCGTTACSFGTVTFSDFPRMNQQYDVVLAQHIFRGVDKKTSGDVLAAMAESTMPGGFNVVSAEIQTAYNFRDADYSTLFERRELRDTYKKLGWTIMYTSDVSWKPTARTIAGERLLSLEHVIAYKPKPSLDRPRGLGRVGALLRGNRD